MIGRGNGTTEPGLLRSKGGKMTKHTPGPWLRDGLMIYALMHSGWNRGVERFKNRMYLALNTDHSVSREEVEANAALIQAAPDLLEALKEAKKALSHHGVPGGDPAHFMADAAIDKAEGRK